MVTLEGFEMESNVARDVLSTASSFGSLPKVVAEYVTNSIDARVNGHPVTITITKRTYGGETRITITDDARGMDDQDIRRFFFMHAENEARRRGRSTRGRFGTGKAAAFGVGTSLQVETRRDGQRWVVRLGKDELEAAVREQRKPKPEVKIDGQSTSEPNGTEIIIGGITRSPDATSIARELRRRLGRQLESHPVHLFGSRIQLNEPQAARTWEPMTSIGHPVAAVIGGDVECHLKAASSAVDESLRGIIVTANGFPVAQIQATGDYALRIFGHVEVLALDQDDSTPGPITDARDLTLNEDNATAGPLADWLRECLTTATGDLGVEERARRKSARDDALRGAASKMAAVLNRHYQGEFRKTRTRAGDIGPPTTVTEDPDGPIVRPNPDGVAGYDVPTTEPDKEPTEPTVDTEPREEAPEPGVGLPRDREPLGEGRGDAVDPDQERPRRRNRAGGFKIDWENAGPEAPRSNYIESELTILINLDHPEIAAAYAEGEQSTFFRMLVFEAAAQEYCYATAYQQLEEDPSMDGSDTVQYLRITTDQLTRNVADIVADLAGIPAIATS